jgi:hypothetical protein
VAFCFHWSERWEDRAIFASLKKTRKYRIF